MKKLMLDKVGFLLFSEEEYNALLNMNIKEKGETGDFLYPAKQINLNDGMVLIAPIKNFKEEE